MNLKQKALKMCPQDQKYNIIAFGVKKRKIVSIGYNSYVKTHPLQAKLAQQANQPERIYLHAEIAAIVNSPVSLDEMFIYRIKNGRFQNAKPCAVCRSALHQNGIKYTHS